MVIDTLTEAHAARAAQGNAGDHWAEDCSIAVPTNARAGSVLMNEELAEFVRIKSSNPR